MTMPVPVAAVLSTIGLAAACWGAFGYRAAAVVGGLWLLALSIVLADLEDR